MTELLRITDVARLVHVHRSTVDRWIRGKRLPVHSYVAGGPRIDARELQIRLKKGMLR